VRKVHDYYFKKAKREKYPARSVYKLEEAQKKYRLLQPGDSVLDLGCQPGSWSMYAARVVGPGGRVIGVDLQEGKKVRLANAAEIEYHCADIMEPDFIEWLQKVKKCFRVVLSDIAPRTSGNKFVDQQQSIHLANRVVDIAEALLENNGNIYFKVFEGEDFRELVDSVRKRFKTTKIVKPKSSRAESREVFVLGMGFMKLKNED
jgi:23S rRNA (uridine2552-2'-O)-methyltransferase